MRAFLALGSNVGDRWQYLRDAVSSLSEVVVVSPVYESDAVGGPRESPPFLNLVVEIETELSPHHLLGICHRLESAAGRVRTERWGPRTLDVDILLLGDVTVDEPDLQIPHPRMWSRRFVLQPLSDVAPDRLPSGWDQGLDGRVRLAGTL